jgi:branched-chain amino acid aminotransferase
MALSLLPFDDRDGWIWLDGEFVPWRDARVHVLTHALHYGSSVFEGARMYDGEVFKLTEHTERLFRSAEILDFRIPYSVAEIDEACKATCARMGLTDAYLRPLAWRGAEQMGVSAPQSRIHVAIACWEWPSYFKPEEKRRGIRLTHARYRRPPPECEPVHSKAAGLYMICTLEKHAAERAGYADALMLDYRGYVAETTGANVFLIRDGVIHTPTPDCFLDGITRQTLIELAIKRGIEVQERAIWPEELESFEGFFLTGSAAEVTFVQSAGPWNFEIGALQQQLARDYDDLVNGR